MAAIIGIPLGTLAAVRRGCGRWAVDLLAWLGFAIPGFWLGYILVNLFAVHWRVLPASGFVPFSRSPGGWFRALILPVVTLAASGMTAIAKQTRDSMLDVIDRDFITALRADGIPERSVIFRHALRNAALPVLTTAGLLFVATLSASVLVAQVFVLPGLGGLAVSAASSHELPVIEGVVLYFAVIVVAVNPPAPPASPGAGEGQRPSRYCAFPAVCSGSRLVTSNHISSQAARRKLSAYRGCWVILCSLSFEAGRRDGQANEQGEQGLDVRTAG